MLLVPRLVFLVWQADSRISSTGGSLHQSDMHGVAAVTADPAT